MNTVAKSTCVACHIKRARTEMRERTFVEHTGRSIGIWGSLGGKGSTRIGQRDYFRKKKVWICNDCWKIRPNWMRTFLMVLFFGPIYVPWIYKKEGGGPGVLYTLTLGWLCITWLIDFLSAFGGKLRNSNGLPNSRIF